MRPTGQVALHGITGPRSVVRSVKPSLGCLGRPKKVEKVSSPHIPLLQVIPLPGVQAGVHKVIIDGEV